MRLFRSVSLIGLFALVLLACTAPPSWSGEFSVVGCEAASGSTTEGWYAERNHGGVVATSSCPTGSDPLGGMLTRSSINAPGTSNQTVPPGSAARIIFDAPPGTLIVGLRASYYFSRDHGSWQAGLSNGAKILRGCNYIGFPCREEGVNQFIPIPFNRTIYIETLCAGDKPCPIDRGSHDPTGLQARAQLTATEVRLVDDSAPRLEIKGGSAVSERWVGGDLDAVVEATDNAGVPVVEMLVDGVRHGGADAPCLPERYLCAGISKRVSMSSVGRIDDGRHEFLLRAFDRAGNAVESSRPLLVDNTAPTQPVDLRVEGGEGWRASNEFDISWRNPAQSAAPIDGARYELCPAGEPRRSSRCVLGATDGADLNGLSDLRVPERGSWWLWLWLRDAAGNENPALASQPVPLGFDDGPPSVTVGAIDPADPTRLPVEAMDSISGVVRGELELRRQGSEEWRPMPTVPTPSGFAASIEDERLPDGTYDVRARAVDAAGNERTSISRGDGSAAQVTLPLRIKTALAVGRKKRIRLRRPRKGVRHRTMLVPRPRVRYGRALRVHGRLTMPGGNPLGGATVEVSERLELAGQEHRPVGRITTSRTGHFAFRIAKGPKRTLRFRYAGTPTIRPGTGEVDVRVKATSSFRANRSSVVNGEDVVFRGRLQGRPLPPTSKLVQLQAYTRAGWRTFANPRAHPRTGLWTYRYRFSATRGRVVYRIRARVPREASYPFETGGSRTLRIKVRGL